MKESLFNQYYNTKGNKGNLFEWVLYRNGSDNIICSREFYIDRFSEDKLDPYNLRDMINEIIGYSNNTGIITNVLKQESKKYSWRFFNPYKEPEINRHEADFNLTEKESLIFEVRKINVDRDENGRAIRNKNYVYQRQDGNEFKTIANGILDANLFPKKVRHFIDITDITSDIENSIKNYLSDGVTA